MVFRRLLGMILLTGLTGMCGVAMAEPAQEDALQYFQQQLQNTQNPVIAGLLAENIRQLKTPQAMAHRTFEIPMMTQVGKGMAVPVMMNQHVMGTFLVDTGATYTVITPRTAQKLGIVIDAHTPRQMIYTANGRISAPKVTLENLTLGGVHLQHVEVIIQDLGQDMLLAGLLGMNAFGDMEVTFRQNAMVLKTSHRPSDHGKAL